VHDGLFVNTGNVKQMGMLASGGVFATSTYCQAFLNYGKEMGYAIGMGPENAQLACMLAEMEKAAKADNFQRMADLARQVDAHVKIQKRGYL